MNPDLHFPKGVLFDIGGTLLREERHDPERGFARILELSRSSAAVEPAEFQRFAAGLYGEARRQHDRGPTEVRLRSVLRLVCERFGLATEVPLEQLELEFWKALCSMRPEPGTRAVIELLRKHSIPIGAVSNSVFSGSVIEWELERNGLLQPFRFVMSTADYGFQKPHPALFQAAVSKLGLRPDEVWFIGDHPEKDIAGAVRAGLTAVLYDPQGAAFPGDPPAIRIGNWVEFGKVLTELLGHK